jgi:SnoaL-like domain
MSNCELAGRTSTRRSQTDSRRLVKVVAAFVAVASLALVCRWSQESPDRRPGDALIVAEYERVLVDHDVASLERLLARNFVFHNLQFGSVQGRRGYIAWSKVISDSYPGFAITIESVHRQGSSVSIRFSPKSSENDETTFRAAGLIILQLRGGLIAAIRSNYAEFGLPSEA